MGDRKRKGFDPDSVQGIQIKLLDSVARNASADPFREPVDPARYPGYLAVIPKPMDFATIRKAIRENKYPTLDHFAKDVRLVFSNAKKYHPPSHELCAVADMLAEIFEDKYKQSSEKVGEPRLETPAPAPPVTRSVEPITEMIEEKPEATAAPALRADQARASVQALRPLLRRPTLAPELLPPEAMIAVRRVNIQAVEGDRTPEQLARDEWAREMRKKFCPPEMITETGAINKEYFKPPENLSVHVRKWGDKERGLLIEGISKHGIGAWNIIRDTLLSEWDEADLRVKAARLMGRQSLALYKGWRGGEKEIQAEYEKNKEIGLRLGAWKGSVLVADENGLVEKELTEMSGAQPAADE